MSNISKLFQRNDGRSKDYEPCMQCLIFSSALMTLGGMYLATGLVFRVKGRSLPYATPGYQLAIKSVGSVVLLFGLCRTYETYQIYTKE